MLTVLLLVVAAVLSLVAARPDSAGIVPLVNGLAYGGIPYGSVSGMVAEYFRRRNDPAGATLYEDLGLSSNQLAIVR